MAKNKKQAKQTKNKKKKLSKGAKAGISLGCIIPVLAGAGAGIAIALVIPRGLVVEGGSIDLEYGNKTDTKAWSLKNKDKKYKAAFEVVDPSTLEKVNGVSIDNSGIVSWDETTLTKPGTKQFKVKATIVESSNQESYYSKTITLRRHADPIINIPTGIVATEGLEGSAIGKPFTLSSIKGLTERVKWSIDSEDECIIDPDTGILSWPSSLLKSETHTMTITATQGYYKVSTNYTLEVAQDIHIIENDGKTDFYNRTAAETMFGSFSFVIRGTAITSNVTWKIYEGESSEESENFEMIWFPSKETYTIKIKTSIPVKNYKLKIEGSCVDPVTKQTVRESNEFTYHGYSFDLKKPKIYGDASKKIEDYQCTGTIYTPEGEVMVQSADCDWTLSFDGSIDSDSVSIGERGIISIAQNKNIHTNSIDKVWINMKCWVAEGEFIEVQHANGIDIQVGTPSLSGGKTEIELDEDGNYEATADERWSLKVDEFDIPSDIDYEIIDVSTSLESKVEIGNSGDVKITGGEDGSFKVQASYNNIVVTTDTINVTLTEAKYEISNLPADNMCYGTQGYQCGLQNNLILIDKDGEQIKSGITWTLDEDSDETGQRVEPTGQPNGSCHIIWKNIDELDVGIYNFTILAKFNDRTISCTLHLSVVEPIGIIGVDDNDTTWSINEGVELTHPIDITYEGIDDLVTPETLTLGGDISMYSTAFNATLSITDEQSQVIVKYTGGELVTMSRSFDGWVEGIFIYKGSFLKYRINISVYCNAQ